MGEFTISNASFVVDDQQAFGKLESLLFGACASHTRRYLQQ
jgi:hypothetical protein